MATADESFVVSGSKWEELVLLIKLSFPLCLTWAIEWGCNIICVVFIGNLSNSSVVLSSLGLSKTLFTMMFVMLYGITTALYTLVPQAIGANKYHLLPVYIQRCIYVVIIFSIPLSTILYFGGEILQYILASEDVEWDRVSTDCKYFILALYLYTFGCILSRIPQATNLNHEILYITIFSCLFVYPSCYLYVTVWKLESSAYALNFATLSLIVDLGILYVMYRHNYLYVFKPVSLQQIFEPNEMKEFLKLGIPGTILHLLETMSFEFSTFYCGLITSSADIAISCATIIVIIITINWFVAMALATSFSVRIGKYVGANMIQKAQECIWCGKLLSLVLSGVTFLILICARKQIATMYSSDEEIIELTANVLYVTSVSTFCFMGVYARVGIFRGIGKPKYSASIVLGSYYIIPLPLMFILLYAFALRNDLLYGTLSIFITVGIGNFIAMVIMEFYLWFKLDWIDITNESQQRLLDTERIHYERIKETEDVLPVV